MNRMKAYGELGALYAMAFDDCTALVVRAAEESFALPTPCSEWNLGELLGHMVGQNHGFAAAIGAGDAPLSAYTPPMLDHDDARRRWTASADELRDAFDTVLPGAPVWLREINLEVDAATAMRMHLLDTAVHGWDVAVAIGDHYCPQDGIVDAVFVMAELIAARPGGAPGVFADARPTTGAHRWNDALRLLGRELE